MRYTASDFGTGVPDMAIANAPNAIAPEIAPRIAPYSPTLKALKSERMFHADT